MTYVMPASDVHLSPVKTIQVGYWILENNNLSRSDVLQWTLQLLLQLLEFFEVQRIQILSHQVPAG